MKSKVSLRDEKVLRGTDMGQRPPSPPGRGGALDSILLGQKRRQRQKRQEDPLSQGRGSVLSNIHLGIHLPYLNDFALCAR